MKMGVVSEGKVVASATIASNSELGLRPLLPKLEQVCGAWMQTFPVSAVGIAFPSLVDVRQKKILGHNNKFADYAEIDLESWVRDRFHLPMAIENDANAAALGEGKYGSAADSGDFVLMILGTGIGTAAVMNGQLIHGKHYQAGNLFGHIPLKVNGRKCAGCPGVGCAEAQASTWALRYMVRESPLESPLKTEEKVDFRVLQQHYALGDPLAKAVFDECCAYWANCLITLIHAYDPEVAVLSGGVLNWGPELSERVIRTVQERVWTPWGAVEFRQAKNPEQSVLLGLHALCESELTGK